MNTYSTVEDYLEVLAGYRDSASGKLVNNWFLGFSPIISLARYDVDVLTSMSEASANNKPLTEKQGKLLCNILLKYQRQLSSKHIDVTPIENPVWRLPLRKMDYTHRLGLKDDKIIVKFPFNTKLIDQLRAFRAESQGASAFDQDEKVWKIALTEFNLNWLHTWAKHNNFEIDSEIESLNTMILQTEEIPYGIELQYGAEQLEITNCPNSLREYIEEYAGGFSHANLLPLVDTSGVLGFTVEDGLIDAIASEWGKGFGILSTNKEIRINPQSTTLGDDIASVLDYAVKVNRLPVVIYEPDMSGKLLERVKSLYPEEEIYQTKGKKKSEGLDNAKFIYTTVTVRNMERIPLLLTSAGMIYGGDKQIMTQRSEKIVYIAADVYNATGGSGNKTRKVAILSHVY